MTPAPAERTSQQRNSGKSAVCCPLATPDPSLPANRRPAKLVLLLPRHLFSSLLFQFSCGAGAVLEPQRVRAHCSLALCLSLTEVEPQAAKRVAGWVPVPGRDFHKPLLAVDWTSIHSFPLGMDKVPLLSCPGAGAFGGTTPDRIPG